MKDIYSQSYWRDRFKDRRGRILGLIITILVSIAVLAFVVGSGTAFDGFFTPLHRYTPDMTGWRIGLVILFGLLGFGLGWFASDQAGAARRLIMLITAILLGFVVVVDHGALGWWAAWALGIGVFLAGLGFWLRRAATRFFNTPDDGVLGTSRWANLADLEAHKLFSETGFYLGEVNTSGGPVSIRYDGDRHLGLYAPNRSGKGTSAIIPNLLTYPGSCVVIDPKGENAMITAQHRANLKQHVFVVDPWGITSFRSACFNALDWLQKGDVDLIENAMILADAIIVPMGSHEAFWTEEAKALLQGIIVYVATDDQEDGQRHLGRVRDLLLLDGEDLRKLFHRMLQSPYQVVRSTAARSLQKEEKLLSNVLASVQAQTHFLDSSRLRENLSRSSFTFEDLKTKPMTVYLVLPADRLDTFGRWLRLLIQQSLTVNARNIEKKPEKPVLFILDEMAALGRLAMVEKAFGLMAGFGIQLWAIAQDLSQMKRIYGDGWETFISNAGVIQYFGSRDARSAEYFSKLCGVTTVWNISSAISKAFSSGANGSSLSETTGETASGTQRPLAYPDELMRMQGDKQLILVENMNPLIARKTPWFKQDALKSLGRNLHAEKH